MRLTVYLTVEGQEQHALGRTIWPWHYTVKETDETAPEGSYVLADLDVAMPDKALCVRPVLSKLAEQERDLRDELNEELAKLDRRRNDLLMLGHTA